MDDKITFEDFKKVEIRMGKITACEKVENADKLLKLQVDFGPAEQGSEERMTRQIVSGIAMSYTPEEMLGKTLPFVINLEFRKFKGEESQGMLMATTSNVADAGTGEENIVLLEPNKEIEPGAEVV